MHVQDKKENTVSGNILDLQRMDHMESDTRSWSTWSSGCDVSWSTSSAGCF
ncbi:class III lanthipeptide [Rhodococcus sp. NPDC057135]|uniref:class III lanthipeptide n=1 Tax=Rhodococcus sp. NPDC057135 TaxID=3346028 RepID=UPI00363841C6